MMCSESRRRQLRRNAFGDAYCKSVDEIVDELSLKDVDAHACHADFSFEPETKSWGGEIRENDDGETVCFLEGFSSANEIRNTLIGVGIPRGDIAEM